MARPARGARHGVAVDRREEQKQLKKLREANCFSGIMNHARGDMRVDCSMVECRGAGGGQGEKFDGRRRPAVSPERHAKQNKNQNHSGGVATSKPGARRPL